MTTPHQHDMGSSLGQIKDKIPWHNGPLRGEKKNKRDT